MKIFAKSYLTLKAFWNLVSRGKANTYYPELRQKSALHIFIENLIWALRKREVNYYYYMQGFDRKEGVELKNYFALPEFVRLRNNGNSGLEIGGRKVSYICLLQDKFLFGQYIKSLGFATPRTLGLCYDNKIFWLDDKCYSPIDSILRKEGMDAFLKPAVGWQGKGIYRIKIQDSKLFLNGEETSTEELRAVFANNRYILQDRIVQHPAVSEFNQDSVNSLRVVTARKGRDIVLIATVFRLGTSGSSRDNWCSGGIAVGVEMETGRLKKYGYFDPKYGKKVACHPDSNKILEGFEIPYYQEAVEAARSLHSFFYGLHSIGWDIAITETGPVFIEGNDDWGIRVIQPHDQEFKSRFLSTFE